ncbi:MAG: ABC transporter permease [Lachnospiraceae bacterium]|nr:ABC transporter permease [Lachnospiraceae bacterium]
MRKKKDHRISGFLARRIYVVSQIAKMVSRNIMADKVRSFMTCLGIIIGTSSLIIMMSIMDIRTEKSKLEIDEAGLGEINIEMIPESLYFGLLDDNMRELAGIEHVAGITPTIALGSKTSVRVNDVTCKDVVLEGVSDAFYTCSKRNRLLAGSTLDALDLKDENKVCVINKKLAIKLFNSTDCVGKKIPVMGVDFLIKGVTTPAKDVKDSYSVRIPYNVMQKMTGKGIYGFTIYPDAHKNGPEVRNAVKEYMDELYHGKEEDYYYDNTDFYYLNQKTSEVRSAARLQMVIAAIALLIGGIGIMNMMLVMVTERTTEIGLRKALGSSGKRIQLQFVMESMMLSMVGGIAGVLTGIVSTVTYCLYMGEKIHINVASAFVGFMFSMAVGVFFGWSPAKAASKLQPIDALKGE